MTALQVLSAFLSLFLYVVLLCYGTALSILFSGGLHTTRQKVITLIVCTCMLGLQGLIYARYGYETCEKLYPFITHLPLLVFLLCVCHASFPLSLISIMISYFCCQPPLWIAMAVQYLSGSMIIGTTVHILSLIVFWYILQKYLRDTIAHLVQQSRRSLLLLGVLPVCYYVFDYATTVYSGMMYDSFHIFAEFLPTVMVMFYVIFVAVYHREIRQKTQLEMDNLILSAQTSQARKVIDSLRDSQQRAITYRHDLRHHVSFLKGSLESGQIDKALAYLNQVQDDIEQFTPQQLCRNETANLILSYFLEKAQAEQISLNIQADLPDRLHVSDTDLCSLLSNSLENAIHACQSIPDPSQRLIRCRIYIKNDKLCLDIRNSCHKRPVFVNGLPLSDSAGHGIGVKSIVQIVERHGGVYRFSTSNDIFLFQASI
ncbi:MAG: sensor histidine kinase [Bulleidia sp.]